MTASARQEPPEPVDRLSVLISVTCRQTLTDKVLNPVMGEVTPFGERNDATRLQIAQQRVCRDDQIVPGHVILSRQRALPQRGELNVRLCERPSAAP